MSFGDFHGGRFLMLSRSSGNDRVDSDPAHFLLLKAGTSKLLSSWTEVPAGSAPAAAQPPHLT